MKKSRLFIVMVLIVSITTGSVYAIISRNPQAYKYLPANGEIPYTAVYNGFGIYNGFASNGGIYVAVGDGGHAAISSDLQNWENVKRFTYKNLIYVAYTGEKFVAFDDRMSIYVSLNGTDWTEELVDIPQNVTRWYDLSFTEDEFTFVDVENYCYYMTRDFKAWKRVSFLDSTPNMPYMHTNLSIRKLNGQYVLLHINPDQPYTTEIYTLSQNNEWVWRSSIPDDMKQRRNLIYFKGNYYAFTYGEELTDNYKHFPVLWVYTSKDMSSWTKSRIAVDTYPDFNMADIHALSGNGKIHLIYSIDDVSGSSPNRYKTAELTSNDGVTWEKGSQDVPARNDILDTEFSILNDKEIFALSPFRYACSKGDNDWKRLELPGYNTGRKDIYYGDEFTVFQEVSYNYVSPDIPAVKTNTVITRDGKNMIPVEAPQISQWTGREFIAGGRATSDFKGWRDVKVPEELSRFKDTIHYMWADGIYLAKVPVYYSGDRERDLEDEMLRQAGYDRTVYIFDGDFNLVGKHMFDSFISEIVHVNSIYFVKLEDGGVFCSDDAMNWRKSSLKELLEQPISNSSKNYIRNDAAGGSITGISISSDMKHWKSVVLGGKPLKDCTLVGDYYVAQDDNSIYASKNGSQWLRIVIPYKEGDRYRVLSTSDSLLAAGGQWMFYYPLDAISAALNEPALLMKAD